MFILAANEMIDAFSGGDFQTKAIRFILSAILSTLIIWLVVRILKRDD